MARTRRWLWFLLCFAGMRLWAASPAENRAFEAASSAFRDHVWERAEAEFAAFRQTYTNSTRLPEAILFQGQARLQRGNYAGAIALLAPNVDRAGNWADEYLFFLGEAQFQMGDPQAAADTFARLVHTYPLSPRRLEALVRQAAVLARLRTSAAWQQVADLLQATNGLFQAVARTNTASEFVRRGYLLLGEALLSQTNYTGAESALLPLEGLRLPPELEWQNRYLLSRIQLAAKRPAAALAQATNLLALAEAARQPALKAESAGLLGRIYEELGRTDDAIAAYQLNLPEGTAPEHQRLALLKITQLYLEENRIAEAAQRLQQFLEQNPAAKSADLAWLRLGELRLRLATAVSTTSAATNATPGTNSLQQAISALASFTNKFPQSPLFGKAQLALGWCFWLSNALPASQAAFQLAVQRLPPPNDSDAACDLAIAHFKLGDTQYRQTNYNAAIDNYQALVAQLGRWPVVETNLCEPALYQIVRAGLAAGNLPAASNALSGILVSFPNGFYADRAVLLTGQTLGQQDPAAARRLFLEFTQSTSNCALLPELQLAIARTYEEQQQWDQAITQYDQWLQSAPTNKAGLPQVLYFRAMANWRAGHQTNTLTQLTNFLDRFPSDPLGPQARWWVADYYDSIGRLEAAEANFELIFQNTNWAATQIAYQAQLEAGRVAFKRTSWNDAQKYFGGLAGDSSCPEELRAQAYFALGSTFMAGQESTNKTAEYQKALNAFDQAALHAPNNPIAILALGEKANCYLQLRDYASASNYYELVLHTNRADVAARSAASVGLGVVLEKLAEPLTGAARSNLLSQASNRYLDAFYQAKILRDGEQPDPFWTMKSGLEAARVLAELLQQRDAAVRIYQELQASFPYLKLGDKINALRSAQQAEARSSNS